ncbi:MAG: hypothetical protein AAGA90_21765 [Actinomycetota bacterium]
MTTDTIAALRATYQGSGEPGRPEFGDGRAGRVHGHAVAPAAEAVIAELEAAEAKIAGLEALFEDARNESPWEALEVVAALGRGLGLLPADDLPDGADELGDRARYGG